MVQTGDPDTSWLALVRERLHWRREPKLGLTGSFDTIAEQPLR